MLRGDVAERVRAIVREACPKARVDRLKGHLSSAHVHGLVASPPHGTIRRLIQRMQGKSASRLLAALPPLRKRLWGRQVGARG